jgi:serine/threonine protein kinase
VYKKDPSTGKHQNVAELFEENTVKYHQNMPRIVKWMTEQVSGRSDLQLLSLIRAMVSETPRERPTATQVWKELVIIHGDALEAPFCGACCMPQDSHLTKVAKVPHPLAYPSAEISPENAAKSATRTSEFETSYSDANRSPYFRNRYLRIDKIYNLDSVSDANTEGKAGKRILCRKTFHRDQNKEDTAEAKDLIAGLAQTEARLLENLTPCKPNGGARHMVNFEATYREGENFAILTTPVTKYNLHEYLSMVELKRKENVLGSWERVLRESSGCLAGTLSYLHKQGIAHGAVSPENILVDLEDNNKIYLANFGEAAVIKRIKDIREVGSKPQVSDLQPFTQSKTNSRPQNPYAPSQGRMSEEIYNATDVFGLGCAALEMETVRLGSSRDAMWKFLLQDPSQNVTNDDKTSSELANGEQPAYNANDTGSTVRPSKKERVSNVSTDAGSKPQSAKKTRSSNVSKGAGSKSQSAKMKQLPVVNGSNDTESKSQPAGGKRSVREAGSKSQPIEEKQPANGSDDTEFNLQPADGKRPTNEGNEDSSAKSTAEADEDDNSTYTWLSGGPNKNMLYDEPRVLARLPEWIQKQCFAENYGALIVRMMDPEPQKRPTAYEIHCSMSKMKDWNSRMMCGKNCVPEEQGDVEKKKAGLEIKETR